MKLITTHFGRAVNNIVRRAWISYQTKILSCDTYL